MNGLMVQSNPEGIFCQEVDATQPTSDASWQQGEGMADLFGLSLTCNAIHDAMNL
jgi:hypothetical protein